MRKLAEADVLAIRADERPPKEVAPDYGISEGQAWRIQTRRSWAWL